MSKENVALFVRMTATKRDLSKKASADRTTQKWIDLGKDVGLSFDEHDVVGFVSELTGKKVNKDNAVPEFLAAMTSNELSGAQLDQVVGGSARGSAAPIQYSSNLRTQLVRAGYTPPGGIGGATYQFPPDDSKQPSAPSHPDLGGLGGIGGISQH